MMYNWQQLEWANFRYDKSVISEIAPDFLEKSNEIDCIWQSLDTTRQQEELIRLLIAEAATTSEIEGEFLSRRDLMSSIKNNLHLNVKPETVRDKKAVAISITLPNG